MSISITQEPPLKEFATEMSEIRFHANLAEVYFSAGATHKALEELTAIIQHAEWATAVVRKSNLSHTRDGLL